MIQALTFDFWDTIAADDSDEPKRAQMGLPSKADERVVLFVDHIVRRYPHIEPDEAAHAYRQANARFREEWRNHQQTPSVHRRLSYAYDSLGLTPPPGKYAALVREVNELARAIETMEVRIAPAFAPHIHVTLAELAAQYTLGIIADTIHTTGRGAVSYTQLDVYKRQRQRGLADAGRATQRQARHCGQFGGQLVQKARAANQHLRRQWRCGQWMR